MAKRTQTNYSDGLIVTLEKISDSLPSISKPAKASLAQAAPIVSLIFGIIGVIIELGLLGFIASSGPFAWMMGSFETPLHSIITIFVGIVSSVLLICSYSGLQKRKLSAWKLVFYADALYVLNAVFSNSILNIIVALLGLYLLFQIKKLYR